MTQLRTNIYPSRQVKILRSAERVDGKGVARSKGFAFVEFSSHGAALTALRATSNNPELLASKKVHVCAMCMKSILHHNAVPEKVTLPIIVIKSASVSNIIYNFLVYVIPLHGHVTHPLFHVTLQGVVM